MTVRTLALIPARGGSKGLPGKNVRPLLGRPLLGWTVEQALAAAAVDRVVVSTDDERIAEVARGAGADVPFLRPEHLATDASPVIESVLFTLDRLAEAGEHFDLLALLEPTSPLRAASDIDEAVRLLLDRPDAASLVAVGPVAHEHPTYVKVVVDGVVHPLLDDPAGPARRQDNPACFYPYGQIFLSRVPSLRASRSFYATPTLALVVERWQCFEIDDLWDFLAVEAVLRERLRGKGER